jgi:hypothetical protein
VIQLGANRSQTGFNIAQALSGDQLSEGHGEELLPAEKLLDVPVAIVVSHAAAELAIRKKTYQLGEDAFAVVHTPCFATRGKLAHISNRGKQKMPITCFIYIGCEIRVLLLPDSRDWHIQTHEGCGLGCIVGYSAVTF